MWEFVVSGGVIIFALTLLLFRRYSHFGPLKRWYLPAFVIPGWFLSFYVTILLPVDIVSSVYDKCEDDAEANSYEGDCTKSWAYTSYDGLLTLWRIVYWTTYIMTWTVYPIMQSYSLAGGFTVPRRMRRAVIENILIYAIAGGLGGLVLIWIAIKDGLSWESLLGIAIALANGWGLLLVVLLLGYGLVEIPKKLFFSSNLASLLKYHYFKLAILHEKKYEAKNELERELDTLHSYEGATHDHDPYIGYIQRIVKSGLPHYENYIESLGGHRNRGSDIPNISFKELEKLHSKIKRKKYLTERNMYLYNSRVKQILQLEDIISAKSNSEYKINWHGKEERTGKMAKALNFIEWIWRVHLFGVMLKLLCVACAILSVTLFWSEITLASYTAERPDDPDSHSKGIDLSLWSRLIHADGISVGAQLFLSFTAFTYLSVCVYWSLFKFRLFDYFRLLPGRQTDASSLFFSALYLGRLTAPLAYNFLNMIHNPYTSFWRFMGDMGVVPILGTSFNDYLPIALVLVALATSLNLFKYVSHFMLLKKFKFDEAFREEREKEGRQIISSERNRSLNHTARSPSIREKYLGRFSSKERERSSVELNQMFDKDDELSDSLSLLGDDAHSVNRAKQYSSARSFSWGSLKFW